MVHGRCKESASTPPEEVHHDCGCHSESNNPSLQVVEQLPAVTTVTIDLSIRYGRCYQLALPNGHQVGSNRENSIYTPDGLFQNIPFRACRSTTDCATGGIIPYNAKFYLQDQMGAYNDQHGRMGWVAGYSRGLRMKFTLDMREAVGFEGAMKCEEQGCPLRLTGVPEDLHFTEVPCESVDDP
jgi:hypothetical protein